MVAPCLFLESGEDYDFCLPLDVLIQGSRAKNPFHGV